MDLVKAFDSVDTVAMMGSLKALAVENPLRSLKWQIHEKSHGELYSKNKFNLERGVKQGCVIGPRIFCPIFDIVCKKNLAENDHLAYADEVIKLAKSDQLA